MEVVVLTANSGAAVIGVCYEICYVNGLQYARDVMRETARYRAHKIGFGTADTAFACTLSPNSTTATKLLPPVP